MGMFDWFRAKQIVQQVEQKATAVGRLMVMVPGEPAWSRRDYASFAKEAYQQNVVAYQAINRIGDALASIPYEVQRNEQPVEDNHPLARLWANPNQLMSTTEFLRASVGYFLLSGNLYWERIDVRGQPFELFPLRSDKMQVVPGADGYPSAYVYKDNGRAHRWNVDFQRNRTPIRHLKTFNPTDHWYGLSPVEAAAYGVDQHNQAMSWMMSLLQNSARPSGILVSPKDAARLSDEAFHRLQNQIEEQYSGSRNAGRPMLLEGGMEWQQTGMSPSDMSVQETKNSAARDIALAFGVPPQLLGIPGDNTYSNYKEARLAFWEDTVIPLLTYMLGEYNAWLSNAFNGAEVVPLLEEVPAIADKKADVWAMADKSKELTINERRALKGYPPLEEVDGYEGEHGNRLMSKAPAQQPGQEQPGQQQPPGQNQPPQEEPMDDEMKRLLHRIAYG